LTQLGSYNADGLQEVGLENAENIGTIKAATADYLADPRQILAIQSFAKRMMDKKCLCSLEDNFS
jgi:hypothetical protein